MFDSTHEGRKRFWNYWDRFVDRVGNGYRLCMMGDMNGWVGDRVRLFTDVAFGVLGKMIMEREW